MYGGVFSMKKTIVVAFMIVLIIMSVVQMILDYRYELTLLESQANASKKSEYCIFIEVEDKTLYLLQDGKCIKKYPIASGKPGWPSPLGFWKIIEKGEWGKGFGGRWLGLNVPWGKYGIHGTTRQETIGSDASHGCIRMYNKDVKELYDIVPHGTHVVIVNGPFGPFGNGFKELKPGARGADVMAIQRRLKELGYFNGYISGIYDDELKRAVHSFQKKNGLPVSNTISKKDWHQMGFREFE